MKRRVFNVTAGAGLALALVICGSFDEAQADGGYTGVWTKKVPISHKAKPDRVPPKATPRPKVERAPLLTVQWRLLKMDANGKEVEVDSTKPLYTGDRIRLAVRANSRGYLYVIQDTEGEEGAAIFPDERINGGKNLIEPNTEIVIPSNCDEEHKDDCWMIMEPPAGREAVTIIFSRDKITTLPNTAEEARSLIKNHVVSSIQSASPKPTSQAKSVGKVRFATWATNMNAQDNEELVTTFYLTHEEKKSNN